MSDRKGVVVHFGNPLKGGAILAAAIDAFGLASGYPRACWLGETEMSIDQFFAPKLPALAIRSVEQQFLRPDHDYEAIVLEAMPEKPKRGTKPAEVLPCDKETFDRVVTNLKSQAKVYSSRLGRFRRY